MAVEAASPWRPVRFVPDSAVPVHIKNIVKSVYRAVTARHVTERTDTSLSSNLLATVADGKSGDDGDTSRTGGTGADVATLDSLLANKKRIFSSLAEHDSESAVVDGAIGTMSFGGQAMYALQVTKPTAKRAKRGKKEVEEVEADTDEGNDDDEDPGQACGAAEGDEGELPHQHKALKNTEEYFARAGDTLTSDNTLAKLKRPTLTAETLQEVLQAMPPQHEEAKAMLMQRVHESFPKWRFQLYSGFNLILYGYGSKKDVVENFLREEAAGYPYLVINGYFPSLNLKHALHTITDKVIGFDGSFTTMQDHSEFIKSAFESDDADVHEGLPAHLFIGLHSIDGPMLRTDKVQAVLAVLASIPQVHIIATVDHINSPLLWDHTKAALCNWLWYDTTTFEPYLREASYENSLIVHRGGLATDGILCVLRSVPENTRGIFKVLANLHLTQSDDSNSGAAKEGILMNSFLTQCREQFLVSTELNMRTQLTEFKDHDLLHLKKDGDGQERLHLAVERDVLLQVLELMDTL